MQVLYLFAPLLVSAALSAFVLRLDLVRALDRPIDGGLSWRGKRLFGDGKTWRGVVVAVVGCISTAWVQKLAADRTANISLLDYRSANSVFFGTAMGMGAMLGELPNSFAKRRLGIAPGTTTRGWRAAIFYLWDQVDLLTGVWPALLPWLSPRAFVVVVSMVLALVVHPIVALLGYLVGARRSAR